MRLAHTHTHCVYTVQNCENAWLSVHNWQNRLRSQAGYQVVAVNELLALGAAKLGMLEVLST